MKIVTTFVTTNCSIDSQINDADENSATYHLLRTNLPISLDIPESESTDCRRNSLRETQVCILQERETELVVLTYGDEGSSSIKPLSHKMSDAAQENR